jgi:hypothetical protein
MMHPGVSEANLNRYQLLSDKEKHHKHTYNEQDKPSG